MVAVVLRMAAVFECGAFVNGRTIEKRFDAKRPRKETANELGLSLFQLHPKPNYTAENSDSSVQVAIVEPRQGSSNDEQASDARPVSRF